MFRVILKRHRRILTVLAVVVLVLGALICASMVWSRQVTNSILVQLCSRRARDQVDASSKHELPMTVDCRDAWNRPVHYFSDGEHFVMVSYGRDGKPDSLGYAKLLRNRAGREQRSNCFSLDMDTVFVGADMYSGCLK
jgi:hypothetical protein